MNKKYKRIICFTIVILIVFSYVSTSYLIKDTKNAFLVKADTLNPGISAETEKNFIITLLLSLGIKATSYNDIGHIADDVMKNAPSVPAGLQAIGNGMYSLGSSSVIALKNYVTSLLNTKTINETKEYNHVTISGNDCVIVGTIYNYDTYNYYGSTFAHGITTLDIPTNSIKHTDGITYTDTSGICYVQPFYITNYDNSGLPKWVALNTQTIVTAVDVRNYPIKIAIPMYYFVGTDGTAVDIPRDITSNLQGVDGTLKYPSANLTLQNDVVYDTNAPYSGTQAIDNVLTGKGGTIGDVVGTITDGTTTATPDDTITKPTDTTAESPWWSGLWDLLKDILGKILAAINTIIGLITSIPKLLLDILNFIKTMVSSLIDGIISGIKTLFLPTVSITQVKDIIVSKFPSNITYPTNYNSSPLVLNVPIGPTYIQTITLDNTLFTTIRGYMSAFVYLVFGFVIYKKITGGITNDN